MASRPPFSRPPVVLAVSVAGTWLRQALASLLKPQGYRVQFVSSGRELLERAAAVRPDIVVLDTDLPDLDAVSVCRELRQNRAAWDMPVMMITSLLVTEGERRAGLEAGAWDYLSIVLRPEELTLKLDAIARLKLDLERALEQSSVNPVSGLYTRRGLERRARELAADALRRHSPLACVALGIETDGPRPVGVPPLRVHAGYEAAANVHDTPIEPVSLIEHAGAALIQARAAGPGERIRAYGA